MEILYYLSSIFLLLFMILGLYDGVYLHIWKYQLHTREESYFEHKTHTIRAILFPLIVWFLFINSDSISFWIGISLVILDLITLGIDAFSEKDSRESIGGLPRWEYTLHLFANGFHFSSIALFLGTKLTVNEFGLSISQTITESYGKEIFDFVAVQMIPGGVFIALAHVLFILPVGKRFWVKQRGRVSCC